MRRLVAAALLLVAPGRGAALDAARAACVLETAQRKLLATDARLVPANDPKGTSNGLWTTVPAGDALGWTQGFFAGSLWLVFEATGEVKWRARAEAWTSPLAVQRTNRASHDLGFKLMPSFGQMARLTGDANAKSVLLEAAASLASRYDAKVGAVKCCDWNPDWKFPVVIDTMMNLELLLWGAANGGDAAWRQMALTHALTTARDLVRADGGTFHVADYDPTTGALRWRGTFQGAGDGTTWSRGEAWALYGFTLAWQYTRDDRMLAAARKVAGYWLARAPADGVPNWDFDSTRALADSSAAAAAASGLLALAGEVGGAEGDGYRARALATLDALAGSGYLDASASEALLLHGVGDLPHDSEIDVGLVYGDYYFLEALLRVFPHPGACATSAPTTPGSTPTPAPTPAPTPDVTPTPAPAAGPSGSSGGGCGNTDGVSALAALLAALVLARAISRPRARRRS